MKRGEMSGEPLESVSKNTDNGVTKVQKRPEGLQLPLDDGALKDLQRQLIESGVKPQNAPQIAEMVVTRVTALHMGPLPPVSDFSGYEDICPGAARDILEMAKLNQRHHHKIDFIYTIGPQLLTALGMLCAVSVVGGMLWAAVYTAIHGHDWVAAALGTGTGLATIAGVFMRNKPSKADAPPPASNSKNKRRGR